MIYQELEDYRDELCEAHAKGTTRKKILSGGKCKDARTVCAREEVVVTLRSTIVERKRVLFDRCDTPNPPPGWHWISQSDIGRLMGMDHSSINLMYRRLRKRKQCAGTQPVGEG